MSETVEKKLPVKNLERIGEARTFPTYDAARGAIDGPVRVVPKGCQVGDPFDKVKVFARSNGTFDVVWYRRIGAPVKVAQAPEKASEAPEKKVHGLKSKDRKKSPKKAQ